MCFERAEGGGSTVQISVVMDSYKLFYRKADGEGCKCAYAIKNTGTNKAEHNGSAQ